MIELVNIIGPAVSRRKLGGVPCGFYRIELRIASGESLEVQERIFSAEFCPPRLIIDRGAVPHEHDWSTRMTPQVPREVADLILRDVLRGQPALQSAQGGTAGLPTVCRSPRCDRGGSDGEVSGSVPPVPRCAAPRQSSRSRIHRHGRCGYPTPQRCIYLRPDFAFPLLNLRFLPFQRPALQFLAAETKITKQACAVTAMKMYAPLFPDQYRHACARPRLGAETVGHSSLEAPFDCARAMPSRQCRRSTECSASLQACFATGRVRTALPLRGARRTTHHVTDLVKRITFIRRPQRQVPTRHSQFRRTFRSPLYRAPVKRPCPCLHHLRDSQ